MSTVAATAPAQVLLSFDAEAAKTSTVLSWLETAAAKVRPVFGAMTLLQLLRQGVAAMRAAHAATKNKAYCQLMLAEAALDGATVDLASAREKISAAKAFLALAMGACLLPSICGVADEAMRRVPTRTAPRAGAPARRTEGHA